MSADRLATFIDTQLQEALSFQEVEILMRQGLLARDETIRAIETLIDVNVPDESIKRVKQIELIYKKYFIKDFVDEQAIYNLKTNYLEYKNGAFTKYSLKKVFDDIFEYAAIITKLIKPATKKNLLLAKTKYHKENHKFRKLKLPYTKYDATRWLEIIAKLEMGGLYGLLYDHVDMGLTVANLDSRIVPYYIDLLWFDIEDVKSQLLWDVLGFIYIRIEQIEKSSLTISSIFYDNGDAATLLNTLQYKGIINDVTWLGIPLRDNFIKSKSGILALVDVLDEKHYLKKEYSRPEKIRVIVKHFNLKPLSSSAERKESKHHDILVDALRKIIPNR